MIDATGRDWTLEQIANSQVNLINRQTGQSQRIIFGKHRGEYFRVIGNNIDFKIPGNVKLKFVEAGSGTFNDMKFNEATIKEMVASVPAPKPPKVPVEQNQAVKKPGSMNLYQEPTPVADVKPKEKFRILDSFFNVIDVKIVKETGEYIWPNYPCSFFHERLDLTNP